MSLNESQAIRDAGIAFGMTVDIRSATTLRLRVKPAFWTAVGWGTIAVLFAVISAAIGLWIAMEWSKYIAMLLLLIPILTMTVLVFVFTLILCLEAGFPRVIEVQADETIRITNVPCFKKVLSIGDVISVDIIAIRSSFSMGSWTVWLGVSVSKQKRSQRIAMNIHRSERDTLIKTVRPMAELLSAVISKPVRIEKDAGLGAITWM